MRNSFEELHRAENIEEIQLGIEKEYQLYLSMLEGGVDAKD